MVFVLLFQSNPRKPIYVHLQKNLRNSTLSRSTFWMVAVGHTTGSETRWGDFAPFLIKRPGHPERSAVGHRHREGKRLMEPETKVSLENRSEKKLEMKRDEEGMKFSAEKKFLWQTIHFESQGNWFYASCLQLMVTVEKVGEQKNISFTFEFEALKPTLGSWTKILVLGKLLLKP